jgi:hypothetical protein
MRQVMLVAMVEVAVVVLVALLLTSACHSVSLDIMSEFHKGMHNWPFTCKFCIANSSRQLEEKAAALENWPDQAW